MPVKIKPKHNTISLNEISIHSFYFSLSNAPPPSPLAHLMRTDKVKEVRSLLFEIFSRRGKVDSTEDGRAFVPLEIKILMLRFGLSAFETLPFERLK